MTSRETDPSEQDALVRSVRLHGERYRRGQREGDPSVARRLAQIGVVARERGAELVPHLKTGQRRVSLEGDVWRGDGFVVFVKSQRLLQCLEHLFRPQPLEQLFQNLCRTDSLDYGRQADSLDYARQADSFDHARQADSFDHARQADSLEGTLGAENLDDVLGRQETDHLIEVGNLTQSFPVDDAR